MEKSVLYGDSPRLLTGVIVSLRPGWEPRRFPGPALWYRAGLSCFSLPCSPPRTQIRNSLRLGIMAYLSLNPTLTPACFRYSMQVCGMKFNVSGNISQPPHKGGDLKSRLMTLPGSWVCVVLRGKSERQMMVPLPLIAHNEMVETPKGNTGQKACPLARCLQLDLDSYHSPLSAPRPWTSS